MIQAIYSQAFLKDWGSSAQLLACFTKSSFPGFENQGWPRRDFLSGSQAKVRV